LTRYTFSFVMSISWCEKKLHQEKPPNPLLEPTSNLDPRLAIISSAAADSAAQSSFVPQTPWPRGPLGLKTLALRMVTL